MKEIYISVDIESDGPIPGPNSMLSLGAAAYSLPKKLESTFSVNLEQLEGAAPDPKTKSEFWDKNPAAWEACRKDLQPVDAAMKSFVAWVKSLPGNPVFVGYPAGYDFTFVYWYMIKFAGESPFSWSALDIKSYAMAKLGTNFRETTKRNMPRRWFRDLPRHTHVALDDAIEQGALFCNIMADSQK